MAEQLLKSGVCTRWAKLEAGVCLCERLDTCGVAIDGRRALASAESVIAELQERYPELPIALILPPAITVDIRAARLIRAKAGEEVAEELLTFCRELCNWRPILSTHALTVGPRAEDCRYLGYPLPTAPRERYILRFLFFRAPKTVSEEELLSVCFPENTQRAANLSVQIARLNRKATEAAGMPIVESVYGRGYRLCGGILPPREE